MHFGAERPGPKLGGRFHVVGGAGVSLRVPWTSSWKAEVEFDLVLEHLVPV